MVRVTVKRADGVVSHVDFAEKKEAMNYFLSQSEQCKPKDVVCLDCDPCERSRDGQVTAVREQ